MKIDVFAICENLPDRFNYLFLYMIIFLAKEILKF